MLYCPYEATNSSIEYQNSLYVPASRSNRVISASSLRTLSHNEPVGAHCTPSRSKNWTVEISPFSIALVRGDLGLNFEWNDPSQ